jgi:dihydrolipoamide dehydrogenase
MKSYDLVIIGAGPGGYTSAIYASRLGLKVCLIEKEFLGGTCLNRGCIPTKVMFTAATLLTSLRDAGPYGVEVQDYRFSPERLFQKMDEVVFKLRGGISSLLKVNKVDLVDGLGVLKAKGVVEVGGEEIRAPHIIVATGSSPRSLGGMEFDGERILSSEDILKMRRIPKSILVVGGGVIGCEFSQFYNTVGARIDIVELMDALLPTQDREVGKKLEAMFKKRGITVHTSTKVENVEKLVNSVVATLSDNCKVECEAMLVSVGRALNSSDLGLEEIGVVLERGRIVVDEFLETNVKGLYAIGDVIGGPMLAHAASYEGMVACDNIAGKRRKVDFSLIPNCIYTEPEIASCGMQEEEARKLCPDCKVAKFPYLASSKAHVIGRTEGFIKVIGDARGRILGIEIFGERACDLIGEASLAMALGADVEQLAGAVHGHPTLSEIFGEASHLFLGKAIHTV